MKFICMEPVLKEKMKKMNNNFSVLIQETVPRWLKLIKKQSNIL